MKRSANGFGHEQLFLNHAEPTNEMVFGMCIIKMVSFTMKLNCAHNDFC